MIIICTARNFGVANLANCLLKCFGNLAYMRRTPNYACQFFLETEILVFILGIAKYVFNPPKFLATYTVCLFYVSVRVLDSKTGEATFFVSESMNLNIVLQNWPVHTVLTLRCWCTPKTPKKLYQHVMWVR